MPTFDTLPIRCLAAIFLLASCGPTNDPVPAQEPQPPSDALQVQQLTANTFLHTSYKQTNDFGRVPCNGLVVRNGGEAIVFDTPTNDTTAAKLIRWVMDSLHCRITAVVPTHFHDDCLGGLRVFHAAGIPSHAHERTITLARANGEVVPQHGFADSLVLRVGQEQVTATFHGEGHTKDNVVGFFPSEQVLFGGCLIKELGAGEGYLGDANVAAWSGTVEAVKHAHPDVRVVVPGHGQPGDAALLDHTITLFRRALLSASDPGSRWRAVQLPAKADQAPAPQVPSRSWPRCSFVNGQVPMPRAPAPTPPRSAPWHGRPTVAALRPA